MKKERNLEPRVQMARQPLMALETYELMTGASLPKQVQYVAPKNEPSKWKGGQGLSMFHRLVLMAKKVVQMIQLQNVRFSLFILLF